jgi:hypothetical protein
MGNEIKEQQEHEILHKEFVIHTVCRADLVTAGLLTREQALLFPDKQMQMLANFMSSDTIEKPFWGISADDLLQGL